MSALPEPIAVISQRLADFTWQQAEDAEQFGPTAQVLVEAGISACSGGKRLRARFCLTGWEAVALRSPHPPTLYSSQAVSVAAALEVFHAAALVHDDLIDNSDTRRGMPAAHRRFATEHQDRGWAGDPDDFGRAAAVLLGDLLVAWSDDLLELALSELAPELRPRVRSDYATMRRDVTLGQFLDVAEESAAASEPDETHALRALRIASLKSARYSIQQPLVIGAGVAGADDDQREALAAFGHPLGMAFQLRDDVLGVFGDAEVTGKPSGDDIREGKRTVLIAFAREALSAGPRRILDELLGDPDLDDRQIATVQATIVDSGALERVETLIQDYVHEADQALSGADLDNGAVGRLRDLARAATERVS